MANLIRCAPPISISTGVSCESKIGMRLPACLVLLLVLCAGAFAQGNMPAPEPEGPNHDNPLGRELWFRRGRIVPGQPGTAARLLHRAYQQKMRLRSARLRAIRAAATSAFSATLATTTAASSSAYGGWVPLGPAPLNSNASGSLGEQDYGPVTGRATSVVADPGDPTGNTVYLGGAYGGLWKSTNAAASDPSTVAWTPLLDQQATLAVGSVAVQPSSSGPSSVVLVGTGEADFSIDSYYGLGILRSADAGNTWTLISSANGAAFSGLAFAKIAFSTDNPNLVVAAAAGAGNDEGATNLGGNASGLYTSGDGGQTWTLALAGAAPGIGSTSVIYDSAGHKFFAFLQFEGYYTSSDGMNWRRLSSQPGTSLQNCPTANNGSPFCLVFRGEMTAVPGREEVYTWYITIDSQGNIGDGGIYKTTNGGGSWQQVSDSGITFCGDGAGNGCGVEQGWFNLTLAAVPNGAGTDLYAGAVNLYKCSITGANPLCAARPFINLTHVYGCNPLGSLSHVHPDQHGISFVRVSPSQVVMYFANDGGIYRALNGYALTSGTCGTAPNPFQNLNATMGSMTQFVDFSNSPSDVNTLLGGTQDNGSPATGNGGSGWISVNGGDGGFNLIDPATGNWFTSNTDVSVQSCPYGINCLEQNFTPVVTNTTVGGDHGFFYTPFILDPQSGSRMIVGTCRLWRGNSNGSGFGVLSYNFDTVLNQIPNQACSGNETQLIRSIAAGGPVTGNGSSVIYVGTEGGYMSSSSNYFSGEIWVTNNADLGGFSWANLFSTSLGLYAISSIAVDQNDPTGNTAYAGVMGFGLGHILQTTNQGVSWTQAGYQLPNAPVNAILIDPDDSSTFYVATDVGVYTSHDLQNWSELGQLPNVAVLNLRMFESGGVKQLRAGTYGRGIWSYDIPYQIKITTPHIYLFPGQSGTINGIITGYNGYSSPVDIACPANVSFGTCTGTTVTPLPSGAHFSLSITANTAIFNDTADYTFSVQGTGQDPNASVETARATVSIANYAFSNPSPNAVSVNRGSISPIVFMYPQSAFYEPITLSCSNLPSGATCNFFPSAVLPPLYASTVRLTVAASGSTPVGTYNVQISATAAGQPSPKTFGLSVTVGSTPDYSMTVTSPGSTVTPGGSTSLQITLTPVAGYTGPVTVACSVFSLTCSFSPSSTVTLAGSPVSLTATLSVPTSESQYMPSESATWADFTSSGPGAPSHDVTVIVPIMDFSLLARANTAAINAGQSGQYELFVSPLAPAFTNPVSFSCSGLPAGTACSFSPANVTPGTSPAIVVLSISTPKTLAEMRPPGTTHVQLMLALLLPGMVLSFSGGMCSRKSLFTVLLIAVLAALLLQVACGGGGSSAPPPLTPSPTPAPAPAPSSTSYPVTVTATSGTVQHQLNLNLVVWQK